MIEELRVKQLVSSVCIRVPSEAYERTKRGTREQALADPIIREILAKLDRGAIAYEFLIGPGLILAKAPRDRVEQVLRGVA